MLRAIGVTFVLVVNALVISLSQSGGLGAKTEFLRPRGEQLR